MGDFRAAHAAVFGFRRMRSVGMCPLRERRHFVVTARRTPVGDSAIRRSR